MTSFADERPVARPHLRPRLRLGFGWTSAALAVGATILTLLMTASLASFVMRGGFGDPDDAMRLVEARAWLAGQSWFDLTAHRLDPPFGASMHWSRLVDLPLASMIRLLDIVVDQSTAERWTRVAVPTAWLFALYLGMARLATVLLGRGARGTAVLGTLFSGPALISFQPGRIGHHAPETVALIFAVGAALAGLDRVRARQAAFAGALVALALSMSLETLPLLAALCVGIAAAWVVRGPAVAPALVSLGVGLGAALPLVFLATVAPGNWRASVCDAYGAPHLGAGLIGAGGAIILSQAAWLRTWRTRLLGAGAVGLLVLLFIALAYPACLRSPFAGVDPLVRAFWLDRVVESKPLLVFMRTRPMTGLMIALPVVLGLVASLIAARRLGGTAAARFAIVAGLTATGLALGAWQVRAFASVTPLALCGGLYAVEALRSRLATRGLRLAATLAPALILPFTATAWAVILPDDTRAGTSTKAACLAPEALAPLAALPPGAAVAPVDLGSHLLVATPLDVFAAPYHRNDDGNRFMLEVFLAMPDRAAAMLARRHARNVITCGGETDSLATRAPDGLAARLQAGAVPAFLTHVPLHDTPYMVFEVHVPAR